MNPASAGESSKGGSRLISTETTSLASNGERCLDGYLARPTTGRGPGLIIFTEMWGVTDSKRRMADEYACNGWCALVPNMFWRSSFAGVISFDQPDQAMERLQKFNFDLAAEDAANVASWLRAATFCSGKVAALGFCIGGRISFLAASRANIDAAIALYALGLAHYPGELKKLTCSMQLHYGLQDRHIPPAEIEAVKEAAKDNGNIEIHLYPSSGHGFFSPDRPTFDPEAVVTASRRIQEFLSRLL